MSARRRGFASVMAAGVLLAACTAVVVASGRPHVIVGRAPMPSATSDRSVRPSTPLPDFRWDDALGVRLPVSRRDGPRHLTAASASGYTQTIAGAALAAANLVPRTSPSVGPAVFNATLDTQVRGANRDVMVRVISADYQQQRQRAGVPDGHRLPGVDAELVGYAVAGLSGANDHAVVSLALTSPDLSSSDELLVVRVSLQWADGDWQLIAPPQGDWSTVSRIKTSPPTGLRRFDDGA